MNALEKQLHSWIPRRPSAKIARGLFGARESRAAQWRAARAWPWLAPAFTCVLAVMLIGGGMDRHWDRASAPDNATFFATLAFGAAQSNLQQTLALTKHDENVEWNVWPHPFRASAPAFARWNGVPTNR